MSTTYHWILFFCTENGTRNDLEGTVDVAPGTTRQELYRRIRAEVTNRYFDGNPRAISVTGFSFGPNQLT